MTSPAVGSRTTALNAQRQVSVRHVGAQAAKPCRRGCTPSKVSHNPSHEAKPSLAKFGGVLRGVPKRARRPDHDVVPRVVLDPLDQVRRGPELGPGVTLFLDEGVIEVHEHRPNRSRGALGQRSESSAGCSTTATTRAAMKRAVRTARPDRVTSVTSTAPLELVISTCRPARVAKMSKRCTPSPTSTTTSTRSPFTSVNTTTIGMPSPHGDTPEVMRIPPWSRSPSARRSRHGQA